jgi:hypothetical protein
MLKTVSAVAHQCAVPGVTVFVQAAQIRPRLLKEIHPYTIKRFCRCLVEIFQRDGDFVMGDGKL